MARYDRFMNLHTWMGVLAGMALFIAFYAGSLMVFHDSLHSWQRTGQVAEYELADAQPFLENVLAQFPAARDSVYLMLPGSGHGLSALWLDESVHGGQWRVIRPAEVDGAHFQPRGHSGLADLVNAVHYSLTIPWLGTQLMGVISLMFAIALISGLVIHWPRIMRELFIIRHGGNTKRYWKNLHNVVGVLSFPFHMMIAITGAALGLLLVVMVAFGVLVFGPDLRAMISDVRSVGPQQVEASGRPAEPLSVAALVHRAEEVAPSLDVTFMHLRQVGDAQGVARVGGMSSRTLAPLGSIALALDTGEVLAVQVAGQRDLNHAVLSGLFALHFGTFGGLGVKFLWFLLGMSGALLFYSGNMLWIASREKHGGRGLWLLARATPGVCLGLCLALSATFVATPLLMASGTMAVAWFEQLVLYIVWGASLALALVVSPGRISLYLLRATALVTALVPVAHGWASGAFVWEKLLQGRWQQAGVDLGALCLAAGFAWLARVTRQRVQAAPAGSLWSLETEASEGCPHGGTAMSRN